jgi:hypothetical protein
MAAEAERPGQKKKPPPPSTSAAAAAAQRQRGVYARPSAAIERGSGFFVPGLEGPRVRLLVGAVLLAATAVNHVVLSSPENGTAGDAFSDGLAAAYSLVVLLQAGIEYSKEERRTNVQEEGGSPSGTASVTSYQQQWSIPVGDDNDGWREKVEWAASSYLQLTPTTHVLLVGPGKVVYSLGVTERSLTDEAGGCQAALDTLSSSQSGRVALPSTHPAVSALAAEPHNKAVVLQTVDEDSQLALLVQSDQLLAAFTRQDLQWLGQLARYVAP